MECSNEEKSCCYDEYKSYCTKVVYIFASFIWFILIVYFDLISLPFSYLLIFPFIYFSFIIYNSDCLSAEVETEVIRVIYFSMLIILGVNLYKWISEGYIQYSKYNKKMSICIFIAFVSLLLSSLDMWIDRKYIFLTRHIRSAFESITVFLLTYVVILYGFSNNNT